MSDSTEKQISDLREVSEAVNEYITQHLFLNEGDGIVDPTEILLQCRAILLEELKGFGIVPVDMEGIILDGYKLRNVINIREVFDEDFLKMFVTGLSTEDIEDLRDILRDKFSVDKEFGFEQIVTFILDRYPNNKKFMVMKYYSSDFFVESKFYDRFFDIVEATVRFVSETKDDNTLIVDYLKWKYNHIANVKKAAEYLITIDHGEKIYMVELRARLSIHDKDLIHGDRVRETALLWKLKNRKDISEDIKALMEVEDLKHHYSNRHHLEFYEKGENISLIDKIEIVSDLYSGQGSKEEYISDVKKEFDEIDVDVDIKEELLRFAELLDLWKE